LNRTDVSFASHGTLCRAWLYRPTAAGGVVPCVVMAHGFGATRDASLAPYAERFAAAGMAVLVFDYRHFGASDGEPRQLVSPRRQLQDYSAAIAFAKSLDGIDPGRIAVWGTSFAGGHALVMSAREPGLAAAVCQCPMMDGRAAVSGIARYAGIGQLLRLSAHGLYDLALAPFGGTHYIPIVGRSGDRGRTRALPGAGADLPAGQRCARRGIRGSRATPGRAWRGVPVRHRSLRTLLRRAFRTQRGRPGRVPAAPPGCSSVGEMTGTTDVIA